MQIEKQLLHEFVKILDQYNVELIGTQLDSMGSYRFPLSSQQYEKYINKTIKNWRYKNHRPKKSIRRKQPKNRKNKRNV